MVDVSPIPEGVHTITPYLTVNNAAQALDFYQQAFGAVERARHFAPDGESVIHAEIQIGDSRVYLSDEFSEMGARSPEALNGTSVTMHLYVEDADALFQQAVSAGAEAAMEMETTFWGDRYGVVTDPFGHRWALATHVEDITPEDMEARAAEVFGE